MGLFNKIRLGVGFSCLGLGLYTAIFPYKVMNFIDGYLDFLPDGEAMGIPYKTMIGVGVGVGMAVTGLALLLDT